MIHVKIVPYAEMENLEHNVIYVGHVVDVLRKLPAESVDCILFSPPYWGVREYAKKNGVVVVEPVVWGGDPGCEHDFSLAISPVRKATPGDVPGPGSRQAARRTTCENRPGKDSTACSKCGAWKGDLGAEPTVQLYIANLKTVCIELVRILKPWGGLFINEGDTYAGSGGAGGRWSTGERAHQKWRQPPNQFPKRSLILVPHRLGIMLEDELGLVIPNDNIWAKEDQGMHPGYTRFGNQHEHVWFACKPAKRPHFYVNTRTMRSQREKPPGVKGVKDVDWKVGEKVHEECGGKGCEKCAGGFKRVTLWKPYFNYFNQMLEDLKHPTITSGHAFGGKKFAGYGNPRYSGKGYDATKLEGRNMRDVWTIQCSRFQGDKFGGDHFATWPEALASRILDACGPREVCSACGLPRVRLGKKRWSNCGCNAPFQRGLALDPFNGAGTTMVAGEALGIDVTGIEIKQDYAELAKRRVEGTWVEPGQATLDSFTKRAAEPPVARNLMAFCKQG